MPWRSGRPTTSPSPPNAGGLDDSLQVIREQMIPEDQGPVRAAGPQQAAPRRHQRRPSDRRRQAPAVDRARSRCWPSEPRPAGRTPWPRSFARLPADFPVPIVIVQHMPPMFTRLLAERLSAQSPIRVQEASSGCVLQAGGGLDRPGRLPHDRRRGTVVQFGFWFIRTRRKTPAGRRWTCCCGPSPRPMAPTP